MLVHTIRRRDVLRPSLRFKSAITGRYVPRWYALLHPSTTFSERRAR
jgi:hypothetical protein